MTRRSRPVPGTGGLDGTSTDEFRRAVNQSALEQDERRTQQTCKICGRSQNEVDLSCQYGGRALQMGADLQPRTLARSRRC